jgi:hypothetical protein
VAPETPAIFIEKLISAIEKESEIITLLSSNEVEIK